MQAQPSHIARTSDFFNECDADRDGLISFDELCTGGRPRFVADLESAYRKSLNEVGDEFLSYSIFSRVARVVIREAHTPRKLWRPRSTAAGKAAQHSRAASSGLLEKIHGLRATMQQAQAHIVRKADAVGAKGAGEPAAREAGADSLAELMRKAESHTAELEASAVLQAAQGVAEAAAEKARLKLKEQRLQQLMCVRHLSARNHSIGCLRA
jgi:hypothetical protein